MTALSTVFFTFSGVQRAQLTARRRDVTAELPPHRDRDPALLENIVERHDTLPAASCESAVVAVVGDYVETLWTRTQKADHETGAADNK